MGRVFAGSIRVLNTSPSPDCRFAGLAVWLLSCVLACLKASGPDLFGGGAALLLFQFVGGAMVEHFWPNVGNIHIGMGGLLAPMAACFLGGTIFILVGIFRVGSN